MTLSLYVINIKPAQQKYTTDFEQSFMSVSGWFTIVSNQKQIFKRFLFCKQTKIKAVCVAMFAGYERYASTVCNSMSRLICEVC